MKDQGDRAIYWEGLLNGEFDKSIETSEPKPFASLDANEGTMGGLKSGIPYSREINEYLKSISSVHQTKNPQFPLPLAQGQR